VGGFSNLSLNIVDGDEPMPPCEVFFLLERLCEFRNLTGPVTSNNVLHSL
jgi:hypothetical protein